jgi:Xaa-Pro dipeptidase
LTLAPAPPLAERERRHGALGGLLAELELDVLVLCANDYRGHKGTLRWAADYNLVHRYGFLLAAPGREPQLLLPENLAMGRRGSWSVATRYARRMSEGLVAAVRELGRPSRIGIVGLTEVMKVGDYLALRAAFPDAELIDAGDAFEHLRARKTEEELEGVRESTRIAEACFERLLELARPGVTERELGAAMYERLYALGGEDPLLLTMYAVDGRGEFGPPGDRFLEHGTLFIFSFEFVGPRGYWMEFARMVTLGEPSDLQRRLSAAVRAGMEAGAAAMLPGTEPADVQRAVIAAVEAHGCRSTYWSGHGIGQDVIEEPWLGLEVVQDRDIPPGWTVEPGMALALHPYVVDARGDTRDIGYMANTYLTGAGAAEPASHVSLDLHVVG